MTTLFAKDVKGDLRVWGIDAETKGFTISWGQLGGALQYKTSQVIANQSGRSIMEQVALEIAAKINKQLDKGYVTDIEEAMSGRTNAIALPRPMLAQPFKKVKNIEYTDAFIQRKYDGNRCLVANIEGELIAYTRNGKRIKTIDHILAELNIPEGTILDGEVYAHGESLQTIVSWIKRKQLGTQWLKYHIYDMVSPEPFIQRLTILEKYRYGHNTALVETIAVDSYEMAISYFDQFREEKYEGAILRIGDMGYEDGKRSNTLVKLKAWQDKEFIVIDVTTSPDGWGILHMQVRNGKKFSATAPGTHNEKHLVAENAPQYIGRVVTIEYAYLTKDEVPFHPIAKAWRS